MIRDDIKAAQISAMKAGDKPARNAISLIQAAIKNRDIEARTGSAPAPGSPGDDALVVEVLQKMVKQRRESIAMYDSGGRPELAEVFLGQAGTVQAEDAAQVASPDMAAIIAVLKEQLDLAFTGAQDAATTVTNLQAGIGAATGG